MTNIEQKALELVNEVRTEYPLVSFGFNKEKTNA